MTKDRTPQGKPKRPLPVADATGAARVESLFWVTVTHAENCRGLAEGQSLMLHDDGASVTVLRVMAPLGVLEQSGQAWVRTHMYSSCVFVQYGNSPRERFQVRITAG
jgi:hypothetical protein